MTPLLGLAVLVLVAGSVVDAYLLLRSIFLRLPQAATAEPDAPLPDQLRIVHAEATSAGFSYLGLLSVPEVSGAAHGAPSAAASATVPGAASEPGIVPVGAYAGESRSIAALLAPRAGTLVTFHADGGYVKTSWPPAPLFRSARAGRVVAQSARDLGDALARHRYVAGTSDPSPVRPVCDAGDLRSLLAATAPLARRELRMVLAMAGTSTALATGCLIVDFATRH